MGKRYALTVVPREPTRGRPKLKATEAVAAARRFRELRAAGANATEAERQMIAEPDWQHLNTRRGLRKLCEKGAAIEADYAFKEFCAVIIGPFGWFMRRDYFSS